MFLERCILKNIFGEKQEDLRRSEYGNTCPDRTVTESPMTSPAF
jgi:hypothetical protein